MMINMKVLNIIIPDKPKYYGHIERLQNNDKIKIVLNDSSNIYCTYILNNQYTDHCGDNVINGQFINKKYKKKEVQQILKSKGFLVPEIYEEFPANGQVYLKENSHEGKNSIFNSKAKAEIFIKQNNINGYYYEEDLKSKECEEYQESKFYFIFGKLFDEKFEIENIELLNLCLSLSKVFSLDVYSIDIITIDKISYIIDLNHCPGFYKSNIARNYFIETLSKL